MTVEVKYKKDWTVLGINFKFALLIYFVQNHLNVDISVLNYFIWVFWKYILKSDVQ